MNICVQELGPGLKVVEKAVASSELEKGKYIELCPVYFVKVQ